MTRAIGSEEQLRSISGTGEASENSFAWRYEGGLVRYPRDVEPPSRQPQHNDRYAKAKVILGLPEISGPSVYRGALLEFFGTTLLVYAHIGLVRAAVAPFFVPSWAPLIVAVTNGALLTLFIIALAAPSGGHVNPTITMATMATGHTPIYRGFLYIAMQSAGSMMGSLLMRATLGWDEVTAQDLAACSLGSLTDAGAFVSEMMFTFVLLLIAYGTAFDPRQGALFGPILAPVFIGALLSLVLFAASGLSTIPGYAPGLNWAMCLGPAVAVGKRPSWVHFIGPMVACLVNAVLFISAPPHHASDGCFTPPMLLDVEKGLDHKKGQEHAPRNTSDWHAVHTECDHTQRAQSRTRPQTACSILWVLYSGAFFLPHHYEREWTIIVCKVANGLFPWQESFYVRLVARLYVGAYRAMVCMLE